MHTAGFVQNDMSSHDYLDQHNCSSLYLRVLPAVDLLGLSVFIHASPINFNTDVSSLAPKQESVV